jgi:DNA-binding NtrC family response regulator
MPYIPNILIIDDDESIRAGCIQTLSEQGYRVQAAPNGQTGLELIDKESFDVVVLDLRMPDIYGIDVLKNIKKSNPNSIVIVITGYGSIDIAVSAMREGATDFLTKPFTPETLCAAVEKAVQSRSHLLENVCQDPLTDPAIGHELMIGRSPGMIKVAQLIRKVAPTDSTVLIYGETGVGKELVATTIHRLSKRFGGPFVTVDCGTVVEALFESEMFGHVKGSFTGATETTKGKFELAHGGSIFLDEIANISYAMQSRLLRILQEREITKVGSQEKIKVDIRITSATNKNLTKEISEGRFRDDLFYRLNVVPIQIPPLRERRQDIPILVHFFLKSLSEKRKTPLLEISTEAMQVLESFEWPGNVRELKNVVERTTVTCEGSTIQVADLPHSIVDGTAEAAQGADGHLADIEKNEITKILRQFNGHKNMTAEFLGINRKTLREKIRKYGIDE